jgi:hypothetical protein
MAYAQSADVPLSPDQKADAEALYRELGRFWSSGVRQILLTIDKDGGIAVGSVNRRIDIRAKLSQPN